MILTPLFNDQETNRFALCSTCSVFACCLRFSQINGLLNRTVVNPNGGGQAAVPGGFVWRVCVQRLATSRKFVVKLNTLCLINTIHCIFADRRSRMRSSYGGGEIVGMLLASWLVCQNDARCNAGGVRLEREQSKRYLQWTWSVVCSTVLYRYRNGEWSGEHASPGS